MRQLKSHSGAALITVLVALMIISIMILEFQFSSMVESKLAFNDLNQLQSYYLAKSGVRVGMLRVALYARAKQDPNLKKQFQNINLTPYLDTIWSLPLPAFPPDPSKVGKLLKSDQDAAAKTLEQTKVSEGQFSVSISTEGSKINLNHLVVPQQLQGQQISFNPPAQTPYQATGAMLITLLDNFLRDSDDPYAEYGDLRPEETVLAISDWVTPGDYSLLGGGKDSFYEALTPPYKAKRNRFYTLDELKLVRTIDEHLFSKLRPHVTVYSYDGKININNASSTLLRALYRDFTEDDIKKIEEEKARIGTWPSEADFVRFVTTQLGRSGFTTQYPTAADYPFTVGNQSFMIESLGFIQRSKSQIQRSIKVGIAMSFGRKDVSTLNPADCGKDPALWLDSRFGRTECRYRPATAAECIPLAGTWDQNTLCCKINNIAPVGVGSACGGAAAAAPGGTATTPAVQTPNGIKVLYWTES